MDFSTFKTKITKYLPENTYITVGDDFGVNYALLVDADGYVHLREEDSFIRVKTSICINDIEFRKDDLNECSFFMITRDNNALFYAAEEDTFYFYTNGRPSGWGSAFEHFTRFPV